MYALCLEIVMWHLVQHNQVKRLTPQDAENKQQKKLYNLQIFCQHLFLAHFSDNEFLGYNKNIKLKMIKNVYLKIVNNEILNQICIKLNHQKFILSE